MMTSARHAASRFLAAPAMREASALLVGTTWLIQGLYSKLLGGSPRHLQIVQATPGLDAVAGEYALVAIGIAEVAIAVWVLSGKAPRSCAAIQTVALLSMNVMELTFASHLLLWPAALIPVNLGFLALAWIAAGRRKPAGLRVRLRRHPIPIQAHLKDCVTLIHAWPADILRPLIPPGLELETVRGYGFTAVALVCTEGLRPASLPRILGQDFILAGYRVFTTCRLPGGRRIRGLRILRSDANRTRMVVGGNLLTHYQYHRCHATLEVADGGVRYRVRTPDGGGDVELATRTASDTPPPGSPFRSWREARRFAGPLPFTLDYEPETDAVIAIQATRATWRPAPIDVDVRTLAFFDQAPFRGVKPILAGAFQVGAIDYRWERGRRYPLGAGLVEAAS